VAKQTWRDSVRVGGSKTGVALAVIEGGKNEQKDAGGHHSSGTDMARGGKASSLDKKGLVMRGGDQTLGMSQKKDKVSREGTQRRVRSLLAVCSHQRC